MQQNINKYKIQIERLQTIIGNIESKIKAIMNENKILAKENIHLKKKYEDLHQNINKIVSNNKEKTIKEDVKLTPKEIKKDSINHHEKQETVDKKEENVDVTIFDEENGKKLRNNINSILSKVKM